MYLISNSNAAFVPVRSAVNATNHTWLPDEFGYSIKNRIQLKLSQQFLFNDKSTVALIEAENLQRVLWVFVLLLSLCYFKQDRMH